MRIRRVGTSVATGANGQHTELQCDGGITVVGAGAAEKLGGNSVRSAALPPSQVRHTVGKRGEL